jgi:hypothetical protein
MISTGIFRSSWPYPSCQAPNETKLPIGAVRGISRDNWYKLSSSYVPTKLASGFDVMDLCSRRTVQNAFSKDARRSGEAAKYFHEAAPGTTPANVFELLRVLPAVPQGFVDPVRPITARIPLLAF